MQLGRSGFAQSKFEALMRSERRYTRSEYFPKRCTCPTVPAAFGDRAREPIRRIERHDGVMGPNHRIPTALVSLTLVMIVFLLSQVPSASSAATPSHHLPAMVLSVKPGLAPYNPALASAGIPVEYVMFATKASPSQPFTCTVVVRHRGRVVGRTRLNANPAAGQKVWTIQVDVNGQTFSARPTDSRVTCRS